MLNEILFQLVLFLSNTMQTITGFAGTLLAMPFSIRLVGIEETKAVLNIFTLLSCLIISIQNRKHIQYKILLKIVIGMFLGMILGIWLFNLLPLSMLLKLYAIMIILVAVKKMVIQREIHLPSWMLFLVLILSGIVHGMFLSGGALLVIYAVVVLKDKNDFRATIAPVWVILNSLLIYSHYQEGYYTKANLISTAVSIIPMVLSIFIGNLLYSRIPQKLFLQITYILLIISGVSLLV